MHEYSIVQALLDQCEMHVKNNNAQKAVKVVIKIGSLSGVEPHLLESAFETFKEKTLCEDATLVMQIQELLLECNTCGRQSVHKSAEYFCTYCESNNVRVIDGEEMYLMQLELE